MRKKSHIALAVYLNSQLRCVTLERHKKAFCLGSILPDLNPKMVTDPHEFDTSWLKVQELICRIETDGRSGASNDRILWRQTGVVLHYLADYFTWPHNTSFPGNLKDHCIYESELKYVLRAFLHTRRARQIFAGQCKPASELRGADDLIAYVEDMHEKYMQSEHTPVDDSLWILEVCSRSVMVIASFFCTAGEEAPWLQNQVA